MKNENLIARLSQVRNRPGQHLSARSSQLHSYQQLPPGHLQSIPHALSFAPQFLFHLSHHLLSHHLSTVGDPAGRLWPACVTRFCSHVTDLFSFLTALVMLLMMGLPSYNRSLPA